MATVSQMARMQSYQNQYGLFKKGNTGDTQTMSTDEIGRRNAEAHIQELRDSGYLAEDNSHKVIVPISSEVKAQVEEYARNQYVNNTGWQLEDEESLGDISLAYTETLDPADRLSASWSVNQYYFDLGAQYKAKINETNPNWPYDGSTYDPSIFDGWSPSTLNITV